MFVIVGSRKTVALAAISRALRVVETNIVESEEYVDLNQSSGSGMGKEPWRLFNENETITMAKLHDELIASNGMYFALIDEIEGE